MVYHMAEQISMIKDMAEIGFIVICAGLVLIFYYQMNKRQQKYIDEDRKNTQNLLNEILTKVISSPYSANLDKTSEYISSRVYDLIVKLRKSTECGRAYYMAYHNGTRDLAGSHFDQMSCRVESVVEGVSSVQLNLQHIPRSFLITWCNNIRNHKNEVVAIPDVEVYRSEDYSFYDFLKSRDVATVLGKAVLDSEGNVRGFLIIEYLNQPDEDLLTKAKSCLLDKAIKIGEQLIILDKEQANPDHKVNLLD